MARVVVVGGGFAGMSAAARLAKLRHQVTLLERSDRLGGRLLGTVIDGDRWYDTPPTFTLPGVLRDLFRKSGRTIDRAVDLHTVGPRRHVFDDGTVLDLPFGTRGAQHSAITSAFGTDTWSTWIDALADPWNLVRRAALESPFDGRTDRRFRSAALADVSVEALASRLGDARLERIVVDPLVLRGDNPRRTPALATFPHYLERNFSRWTIAGGPIALAEALVNRLAERKVEVLTGTAALDVVRRDGRVAAVTTRTTDIDADIVVWSAPVLPYSHPTHRLTPRTPSHLSYVRWTGDAPRTDDIAVHLRRPAHLWHCGDDRWTVRHLDPDPTATLEAAGLLGTQVVSTLAPGEVRTHGHPGWSWRGWRTARRLPGVAPTGGLFFAGAHAHPAPGLEWSGMATAAIATAGLQLLAEQ